MALVVLSRSLRPVKSKEEGVGVEGRLAAFAAVGGDAGFAGAGFAAGGFVACCAGLSFAVGGGAVVGVAGSELFGGFSAAVGGAGCVVSGGFRAHPAATSVIKTTAKMTRIS